jgi:hypothetical protein
LILVYQGLDEESLDKKSTGPPGWGLMQQASPLLIGQKRIAKKPIGNKWVQEDVNTLYNLLNNNNNNNTVFVVVHFSLPSF